MRMLLGISVSWRVVWNKSYGMSPGDFFFSAEFSDHYSCKVYSCKFDMLSNWIDRRISSVYLEVSRNQGYEERIEHSLKIEQIEGVFFFFF